MAIKLNERRGSSVQKFVDQKIGPIILLLIDILLFIKQKLPFLRSPTKNQEHQERELLVCFGAIGDLIVLTEAAKCQKKSKTLFLACSKLNYPCALLYTDFYAGIKVVDLSTPWSIYKICHQLLINKIFDSTQWANIGSIQVGMAKLLAQDIVTVGFETPSLIRNGSYDRLIAHRNDVHELANFYNLLKSPGDDDSAKSEIIANSDLPKFFPALYTQRVNNKTGKLLFHLWPSGNRSHLKEWPLEYWVELIEICHNLGYTIYLSGAPADKNRVNSLMAQFGLDYVVNIAGLYDLSALREFVSKEIEFAVSVNTGILHLLVEAGLPVIGLHGGVNPERWGPLGSNAISLLPQSGPSAYLHYGFEYPEQDEDAYSLGNLTVDQVTKAIARLRADG